AAPPLANPSTSTDPVTGLTVATIARQATDPGQPGFYSLNRHDGPDGSYWDASGGTLATPERPILPMVSVDVSAAGLQATGVLVTDLTSVDLADINPVMPAVTTTGGGVSQTELQAENIAVPASLQYLGKGAAGHDTVNLVTGMFNQSMLVNGKTVGRQRLFTDIKAMTFYAPAGSSNAAPATIISARSALVNGLVTFTIEAEPQGSDTVKQALILFKEPGTPKWKSVSLLKGAGRSWAGAAAATGNEVEYFVQTVTDKGKVSVLANKARLLLSQAAPPPIGHVVTNITGSPAPDFAPNADGNFGAFFKTAAVTLVPTSPETIVGYGVNGPINRVATGPIYFEGSSSPAVQPGAIRGDGLHTINYRATDGSTGTLTVRIDSGGPDITLTSPTAGARYPLHGAATLGFACTDSGSGVKAINGSPACTATVDGQPVTNGGALPTGAAGLHVMVVNSADNAGFTTTKTLTYSVGYVFEGFFSPIVEGDSYEAQAGDNIPFKWRLTDANGNQITHLSAVTSFASYRYTCSSPTPSPTPPPGSTEPDGLKHDGDQYHYNWKTAKGLPPAGYAGTCRRVVLTFDDTTQQTVNVSFK
ncbi:MAG: PxKF domain-containing protein, partial [Acidimicrobiales bacterium]